MNRFLQWFNLFGICALASLCSLQWRTNRLVNLRAADLERVRLEQLDKIADQEKTIKGCNTDLDDFRQRLTLSESALKEADEKFRALERDRDKLARELAALTAQRDQLKADVDKLKADLDKWIAAVAARDAALKQANDQLQKLAVDRNDAIAKFNDLADKYNTIVKDLNAARAKQ